MTHRLICVFQISHFGFPQKYYYQKFLQLQMIMNFNFKSTYTIFHEIVTDDIKLHCLDFANGTIISENMLTEII